MKPIQIDREMFEQWGACWSPWDGGHHGYDKPLLKEGETFTIVDIANEYTSGPLSENDFMWLIEEYGHEMFEEDDGLAQLRQAVWDYGICHGLWTEEQRGPVFESDPIVWTWAGHLDRYLSNSLAVDHHELNVIICDVLQGLPVLEG